MIQFNELQKNDIFRFTWEREEFIGIVTNKSDLLIHFDDLMCLSNKTIDLSEGTSISSDGDEQDFQYKEFISTYKPKLPIDLLKETNPEYFL